MSKITSIIKNDSKRMLALFLVFFLNYCISCYPSTTPHANKRPGEKYNAGKRTSVSKSKKKSKKSKQNYKKHKSKITESDLKNPNEYYDTLFKKSKSDLVIVAKEIISINLNKRIAAADITSTLIQPGVGNIELTKSEFKKVVFYLEQGLKDSNQEVRFSAAYGLVSVNQPTPLSIKILKKNLSGKNYFEALGALSRIGIKALPALDEIINLISPQNLHTRPKIHKYGLIRAINILATFGPKAKKSIPILIKLLYLYRDVHSINILKSVTNAIKKIGISASHQEEAFNFFLSIEKNEQKYRFVKEIITALAEEPSSDLNFYVKMLRNGTDQDQYWASRVIRKMKFRARAIISDIKKIFKSWHKEISKKLKNFSFWKKKAYFELKVTLTYFGHFYK